MLVQVDLLLRNKQTQNPLFLTLVLEELVSFGVYERIELKIAKLAACESITDLLEKIFARLESSFKVSDPVDSPWSAGCIRLIFPWSRRIVPYSCAHARVAACAVECWAAKPGGLGDENYLCQPVGHQRMGSSSNL